MIPFASQRGYGQDLATHLLNTHDNETLEFGGIRGAIADDLHGAFSEWEAQAHNLTKCRNYLYSLSVNPDPKQPLTREQYLDYVSRVEDRLGLSKQPRAIVFHKKYGREHCHVVWSRIDAESGKAVHIGFDRRSLMMVTKEFARDHGLALPEGYEKEGKSPQLSLYDKAQRDGCGITMEQRIREVTVAWKQSDSPRAFVSALADRGYVLATGKRPYVLVDVYGNMNALPKLVDDRSVRTKDIRKFLEKEFPPENLPSVDEARAAASKHRQDRGEKTRAPDPGERRAALESKQQKRRDFLLQKRSQLEERQTTEQRALVARQQRERRALTELHRAESAEIRAERLANRPSGLAAFLRRVTGVQLITKKVHAYQYRRRHRRFLEIREELSADHRHERDLQEKGHQLQVVDFKRHERSLGALERKEKRSLELTLLRESRVSEREGREGESGGSAKAEFHLAAQQRLGRVFEQASGETALPGIALSEEFTKVAREESEEGKQGSSKGPEKKVHAAEDKPKRRRRRRRRRDRDIDRGR